ncbi:unnamed protein product [Soboliphyme baturini]|uniref:Nesprin-1-like n=1 Tax=Soboliphyme baturini TaxID=241478 RepID=A0A183J2E7_9BILA|nr:unnamed protein product [Soboliphyme baturini]
MNAEIAAHEEIYSSLMETAKSIFMNTGATEDRTDLKNGVACLSQRWEDAVKKSKLLNERLEQAQEQWERLVANLRDLIYWTETSDANLSEEQPVGGDLQRIRSQLTFVRVRSDRF